MLKYVFVFCIISFIHSYARIVGDFHQLILVQQLPVTSFFTPLKGINTNSSEFLEYFTNHWLIFNTRQWVISGLWAADRKGEIVTECRSPLGDPLKYNHENMNENFIFDLSLAWPTLRTDKEEETIWTDEYNKYGSCISIYETVYFEQAMILLAGRNLGNILGDAGIVAGKKYDIDSIAAPISKAFKRRVYMKCLKSQNNLEQYLFQVQICFNKLHKLVNCYHHGLDGCDENILIHYPGSPAN